jgi:hypothetical protein
MPELERYGNHDVTEEYRLLAIRDILGVVPGMFEWMYTEEGLKMLRKTTSDTSVFFIPVGMVRCWTNIAGLAVHGKAVFEYGGM